MVSALVRNAGAIERIDCAAKAWDGPPNGTLAWWKSRYILSDSAGPKLAPADVLLDVLEDLESHPEDKVLRYLVALQLVRRKVLKIDESHGSDTSVHQDPPSLVLKCRKRQSEYRVQVTSAEEASAEGVQERLQSLLWSGGEE